MTRFTSASALALCALFLVGTVCADDGESDVAILNATEDFDRAIENGDWLIKFYAPWCGHCKRLTPVWEQAATELKGQLNIAKVDCTADDGVCSRFSIKGYPTLKFFRDGRAQDYKGKRSLDDIRQFAKKMNSPAVTKVQDGDSLKKVTESAVVVAFLGSDHVQKERFEAVARGFQGGSLSFVHTSADFLAEPTNANVVILKDGIQVEYSQTVVKPATLTAWVEDNRHMLLPELGAENFSDITGSSKMAVVAMIDPKDTSEGQEAFLRTVKGLSKAYSGKYVFAWLNAIQWAQFATQFDVNEKDLPALTVLDASNDIHFSHTGPSSEVAFTKFLDGVLAGDVDPRGAGAGVFNKLFILFKKYRTAFLVGGGVLVLGFVSVVVGFVVNGMTTSAELPEELKAD